MTASRKRLLALAAVAVVGAAIAAPADAQAPQQPRRERIYRGLFGGRPPSDPDRTRQEFDMTTTLTGGYDDNIAAAALGSGTPSGEASSGGYLGNGAIDFQYFRGRVERSFTLDGGAYGAGYSGTGVSFVKGGQVNVSGTTRLRTRDTFQASQSLSFDPLFTLNPLTPLDSAAAAGPVPGSNTTTGLLERRSWSSTTGMNYTWMASRRNNVGLSYGFAARRYPEGDDVPGDSNTHRASASLSHQFNRRVSLRSAYDFSHGEYQDADGARPLTDHTISAGPQIEKVFSRTRRLQLSTGIGAQYVKTTASIALRRTTVDYWTPFGQLAAVLDLSRTWDMTFDYRRGTTVLPEVTTESFVTDGFGLSTGGTVGTRLVLEANARMATGTTATAAGGRAENRTLTFSSQARWAFGRRVAATVSYDYYTYEFTNVGDLPDFLPPESSRNSVSVGVTFWFPLVGGYVQPRSGGRAGRS